ncbi:MAG TPA: hypothetical protein VHY19_13205 [Steroidobacteraceae bacterium]|jgi:hypothetical protein|nr:hypothetical protein [Steroidobacteraceae bacterium]
MQRVKLVLALSCSLVVSLGALSALDVVRADTTMPVREGALSCDRACLNGLMEQYLQAIVAHDPGRLPLTSDVKFTENTVRLNLTEGLWKTATGLGRYKLYVADPWAEQAGFMGVVMERDGPKFLGVRLRIKNKRIKEIETVVGRPGSSDPLPKNLGTVTPKATWEVPLKAAERVSRDDMVTAANDYFEAIDRDAAAVAPWDPGFFWLVDEELGIVYGASCSRWIPPPWSSRARARHWVETCNGNRTPASSRRCSRSRTAESAESIL